MFNKRIVIFVLVFFISGVLLILNWHSQEESALPSSQGVVRTYDLHQDLSGQWEQFSSLRAAWSSINKADHSSEEDSSNQAENLLDQRSLYLPSSTPVKVVARKFAIPQNWSSREILLSLRGVYGQAKIYLNGITLGQQVAEFDGNGGSYSVLIPPTAFKYGEDNILLIEMNPGSYRTNTVFNLHWPKRGMLTGNISLDAVMVHFEEPAIHVDWGGEGKAMLSVSSRLRQSLLKNGVGWTIEGVLIDGSTEVARTSTRVEASDALEHPVELQFTLDQLRLWSIKDPFLYQLVITIINDHGDVDRLSLTFGLRRLSFDHGLSLNQQALLLNGLYLSPDTEARVRQGGNLRQWLLEQKNRGYNFIYFAGFPDELWLEAADQAGIGIWAEWPVNFVASRNLPDPEQFANLTRAASRHPSLWCWTVGKGLGPWPSQELTSYWTKATALLGDTPGFILQPDPLAKFARVNLGSQIPSANILRTADNQLNLNWIKLIPYSENAPVDHSRELWRQLESSIAKGLAVWSIIVLWQNIRSRNWRYKELQSPKPKRDLRHSWRWHGVHFLTREVVWAGILTALMAQDEIAQLSFLSGIWPLWDLLQLQSPWLIWLYLSSILMMIRIMQVGVVAPLMPESPHYLGLAYWLERRYRWYVLVAILWALSPYLGIHCGYLALIYLGLSLLFLPLRIRDVHRIGGKYRGLMLVPLLLLIIPVVWGIWRWPDLIYLGQWLYQFVTLLIPGS